MSHWGEETLQNVVMMHVTAGVKHYNKLLWCQVVKLNNNGVKVKMTDPAMHAPSLMRSEGYVTPRYTMPHHYVVRSVPMVLSFSWHCKVQ